MENTINYVNQYQDALDQLIVQEMLTSNLETASSQINWLNAKTFNVQSIATDGYKPHTRNKGYNEGSVTTTQVPYTLDQDRDIEFFVDIADVDESRQAASVANITREFTNRHASPEIDAFRFSKLAQIAEAQAGRFKAETLTADTVYDSLKDAILPLRKYGPQNIVGYVSSNTMDLLERSSKFTRTINVQNLGGPSTLESRITAIDGVRIIEVWDDTRFKDKYDFTNGFAAAADAKDLNALFVVVPNVIAKAKFNSVYLFAPGQHTEGDGYLYQNRMYHGLFMLENKKDGVFASVVPSAG